ncbi:hypothetical protein WJU23_00750 [Prosthecobacter sp. SYSU 5D2]|uniref:hypothetical protein n=1 Tax=Prosthecobacter sp. SYSU 5D2 TaxID=3134134 RepID=UPI0031FEF1C3
MIRSLILFIALLAQALPVPAMMRDEAEPVCSMSCCAVVAAMEAEGCGCVDAPVHDTAPAPVQAPSGSGRELLAQPQWSVQAEALALSTRKITEPETFHMPRQDPGALTQPHVRLPVLFCSLLT